MLTKCMFWWLALLFCLSVVQRAHYVHAMPHHTQFKNKFNEVFIIDMQLYVYNSAGNRNGLDYASAKQKCADDGAFLAKVTPDEQSKIRAMGRYIEEETSEWSIEADDADVCRSSAVWLDVSSDNTGIALTLP